MRKPVFIILILLSAYSPLYAQNLADSVKALLTTAKDDTNKVNLLIKLSDIYFQQDLPVSRSYGEQALKLATSLQYPLGMLRGNNLVARCYAIEYNLPLALKYFQDALLQARQMKDAMREGITLSSISAVYTTNADYDKALEYALEAKRVNERAGIKYMVNLMINIGMLYSRQLKYDEALQILNEGLQQEQKYGTPASRGELATLYSNFGGVYLRRGDYVPAIQNYLLSADINRSLDNTKNYTLCVANLGECYLRLNINKITKPLPDSLKKSTVTIAKATSYLQEARALSEQLELIEIQSEVYQSLATLYGFTHQYDKAFEYLGKHLVLKDSLYDYGKEKEFARIEASFAVRAHTDSLRYLNNIKDKEISKRKLERNGGILLIGLAGVIGLLLINRQKLKHIQKRKIAEADKQRTEELAREQLDAFTKNISEKNKLIETFSQELEKYRSQHTGSEAADKEQTLQLLQNAVILNDEQWNDFKSLFNKVHIGYIDRVKEKYPDLTTGELRTILLAKLGLSNKEMAAMLGVGLEAVRVNKHRLLKKIQLPEEENLEDWARRL